MVNYPPKTIHQLLCGVLRHMRSTNPGCPNFLDKKDSRFKPLHGAMDSHFHHLHSIGIGRDTKHARVLSKEDEEKLWKSGVVGTRSPKGLQNAAFLTVGKMFSLRGGVELRELKPSQIQRQSNPDHYVYTENVSKTRNGTFKQLHVPNKVVPLFKCPQAGERCPVHILDTYFSKLPKEAFTKDVLFFRPLGSIPASSSCAWYSGSQPVGKNTLEQKLSRMCTLAGIEGRITNHSLRATSATQMYENGVPEKVIQERTGHRSLEALCIYERTNRHQQEAASNILSVPQAANYHARTTSVNFEPALRSNSTDSVRSLPISFGNLYGCTVNIHPATSPPPAISSIQLTRDELDDLFSDF